MTTALEAEKISRLYSEIIHLQIRREKRKRYFRTRTFTLSLFSTNISELNAIFPFTSSNFSYSTEISNCEPPDKTDHDE